MPQLTASPNKSKGRPPRTSSVIAAGTDRNPHVIRLHGTARTTVATMPEIRSGDHLRIADEPDYPHLYRIESASGTSSGIEIRARPVGIGPHLRHAPQISFTLPHPPIPSLESERPPSPPSAPSAFLAASRTSLRFRETANCTACGSDIHPERIMCSPVDARDRVCGCQGCETIYCITDDGPERRVFVLAADAPLAIWFKGQMDRIANVRQLSLPSSPPQLAAAAQKANPAYQGDPFDAVA